MVTWRCSPTTVLSTAEISQLLGSAPRQKSPRLCRGGQFEPARRPLDLTGQYAHEHRRHKRTEWYRSTYSWFRVMLLLQPHRARSTTLSLTVDVMSPSGFLQRRSRLHFYSSSDLHDLEKIIDLNGTAAVTIIPARSAGWLHEPPMWTVSPLPP